MGFKLLITNESSSPIAQSAFYFQHVLFLMQVFVFVLAASSFYIEVGLIRFRLDSMVYVSVIKE